MLIASSVLMSHSVKAAKALLDLIELGTWSDYTFDKAIYVNTLTKMVVTCTTHGEFLVSPSKLKSGQKCPKCVGKHRMTEDEYALSLSRLPTGLILLGAYTTRHTKTLHRHKDCGHEWQALPDNVLTGTGCPKCAFYGFNPTLPATLYYISIDSGTAYKIGITNRKVSDRFCKEELERIKVIKTWDFVLGDDAYTKEQFILNEYKWAKYYGDNLLNSGNTEMFYTDVLHLDYSSRITT